MYSAITYEFSHNREKYIGLAEAFTGLGLMMGPVLGSILYSMFTYLETFLSLALILILNMIVVLLVLPSTLNYAKEEEL